MLPKNQIHRNSEQDDGSEELEGDIGVDDVQVYVNQRV